MNIKTYIHAHETNRHRVGKFGNCAGPIRPIYNEYTIMYTCLNTKHKAQTIYECMISESKIQHTSNRSNNHSMPIKSICNSQMRVQSCMQICAHTAYNREKIKKITTNKQITIRSKTPKQSKLVRKPGVKR